MTISRLSFIALSALFLTTGCASRPEKVAEVHAYSTTITATTLLRTIHSGDGKPLAFPVPAEVVVLDVVIPVGAETGWHHHPAPGFAYVVSGELVVDIAHEPSRHFRAGEAFAEVVGLSHNGRAVGNEPVHLIAWFSAVPGTPVTVKESATGH